MCPLRGPDFPSLARNLIYYSLTACFSQRFLRINRKIFLINIRFSEKMKWKRLSREGFEPTSLKAVFFACCGKSLLEVRTVRLRKSSSQPPEKYGFKVLRILTAINLGKSRQTNAIILCRIISEFNADFANFAPLKLMWFKSLSAKGEKRFKIGLRRCRYLPFSKFD